jgi:hypothetical protein
MVRQPSVQGESNFHLSALSVVISVKHASLRGLTNVPPAQRASI